jgi:hypothetical protein
MIQKRQINNPSSSSTSFIFINSCCIEIRSQWEFNEAHTNQLKLCSVCGKVYRNLMLQKQKTRIWKSLAWLLSNLFFFADSDACAYPSGNLSSSTFNLLYSNWSSSKELDYYSVCFVCEANFFLLKICGRLAAPNSLA